MSHLTRTHDHARAMVKAGGPDVELWAQIADEIDDYLGLPVAATDLFGDVTTEPMREPEPEEAS
jgi:hypothetical protein